MLYEQEDEELRGSASVQTEHAGYSGSGYVGGIDTSAPAPTVDGHRRRGRHLRPDPALRQRAQPVPGSQDPHPVRQRAAARSSPCPRPASWQTYGTFRAAVELHAGANTVELRLRARATTATSTSTYVHALPAGRPCATRLEDGVLAGGAKLETEHAGYTGSGYVGGIENAGASTTVQVDATVAGDHPVTLRYANGPNPAQPDQEDDLEVNGGAQQIRLPDTGSWKTGTWTGTLPLEAGANTVAFRYTATDDGNVNLDHLDVQAPVAVSPTPRSRPTTRSRATRSTPAAGPTSSTRTPTATAGPRRHAAHRRPAR